MINNISSEEIISLTNILLSGLGIAGFFLAIWIYLVVERRAQKLSNQISTIEQMKIRDSIKEYLNLTLRYSEDGIVLGKIHNPNVMLLKVKKIITRVYSTDFVIEPTQSIPFREFPTIFKEPVILKKGQSQEISMLAEPVDLFLGKIDLQIIIQDQFENDIMINASTTAIEHSRIDIEYRGHFFI